MDVKVMSGYEKEEGIQLYDERNFLKNEKERRKKI